MTLYEIIFLIMFAVFNVLIGVVAVAEMLTYARSKNLTKTIEVYQKNFDEIKDTFDQLMVQMRSLERRIEKLEPKVADSMYLKTAVYPTKEKIEEIVDYKVENAALKKEIEECRKLLKEKSENIKQLSAELIVEQCKSRERKGENNV